jgi:hypothetical protein
MAQMKNPTHREVSFNTWWKLFDTEMREAGLPAPGMQDSQAHYEMGQSPATATAEALAGNL